MRTLAAIGGFYAVLIVAIVFGFVYSIVKMAIEHAEKVQRMKYGYPLKDGTVKTGKNAEVIDHRGDYGNGYHQSGMQ